MIPDFKTYINETIWGDINRRSQGNQVKKEDDVNNLDCDGLKDYITSRYKPLKKYAMIAYTSGILSVPVLYTDVNNCIMYNPDAHMVCMTYSITDCVDGLLEKIEQNFLVEKFERIVLISPKNKGKITNRFFIEVIDFLLDNIQDTPQYQKSIEKI